MIVTSRQSPVASKNLAMLATIIRLLSARFTHIQRLTRALLATGDWRLATPL